LYALLRQGNLLVYRWLDIPPLFHSDKIFNGIAAFFAYNLPDGLWLLAGCTVFRLLWLSASRTGWVYTTAFFLFALGLETLQLLPKIPGTFDSADLLTMVSAALIESGLYTKFYFKRIKNEC
jgi:hypothetical protein